MSFSPCIEQVQRTCEALKQHGFVELATTECLQKELQVQKRVMPVLDLPQPKVTITLPICIMFVYKVKVKLQQSIYSPEQNLRAHGGCVSQDLLSTAT